MELYERARRIRTNCEQLRARTGRTYSVVAAARKAPSADTETLVAEIAADVQAVLAVVLEVDAQRLVKQWCYRANRYPGVKVGPWQNYTGPVYETLRTCLEIGRWDPAISGLTTYFRRPIFDKLNLLLLTETLGREVSRAEFIYAKMAWRNRQPLTAFGLFAGEPHDDTADYSVALAEGCTWRRALPGAE